MTALRMSRFGVLLTFTVLCLIIGEQYPFSSFPMYSSFSHDTYYIYLADQFDRPIAAQVKFDGGPSLPIRCFQRIQRQLPV